MRRSRDRFPLQRPFRRPYLWLLGLWAIAAALRFWGLGRFNTLVFDEVYFVQYAADYLRRMPFFDGHPPLSKYLIALGIAIGQHLPWGQGVTNGQTGLDLSPWSYRWLNALVGSLLPLVLAWVGRLVTGRWAVGLAAGALLALDGLFLVESRYGLNNVYLVGFGLLGQGCWLRALQSYGDRDAGEAGDRKTSGAGWRDRGIWWLGAGICFGATLSVKWNGLGFLVGPWLLWSGAMAVHLWRGDDRPESPADRTAPITPLRWLPRVSPVPMAIALAALPLITYGLLWIPHLHWATDLNLWEINKQILTYHRNVGDGREVHPYCSRWYTWPLLLRPIAYFYARTVSPEAPINYADLTPKLPPGVAPTIYDVHALGNPLLWWAAAIAVLVTLGLLGIRSSSSRGRRDSGAIAIAAFWLINYGANWLPWARISRCTFLYHYMGALCFAILALAWLLVGPHPATDRRPRPYRRLHHTLAWGVGTAIAIAFLFWLPIYLGLPLDSAGWTARIWRWKPFLDWL
ncbi:MAG: phospholipid carrier-dependent glycosyltransferase [Cyanobacteria bacterium]|nr:phospholipid carrier-dependent glycosyltransferase [Cyanobacteriota bacterium]